MTRFRVVRTQALTTADQIEAVFSQTTLYRMAAVVPYRQPVGRPPLHPAWALLGYGVLARVFRSGARTEAELATPEAWPRILTIVEEVRQAYPELDIPAGNAHRPPDWAACKNARNRYFASPDVLAMLRDTFTEAAVEQAHTLGLLDPKGTGSLCHPSPARVVYGDGTVIRPMYRPPAARRSRDAATGEVTVTYLDGSGKEVERPQRRFDPDAADYHGHTGSVHGQNYVGLYARGDQPHQRVVLAVDRVPRPGLEADTAVSCFQRIHPLLSAGVQAFVYDGAIRGTHIDTLMTECGVLVINKVHGTGGRTRAAREGEQERWHTLGTWEHDTKDGACSHHLAAIDGAVHEFTLDETGVPAPVHRLELPAHGLG